MNTMRNAKYQHLEATPFAGALGAEIAGIDLSQGLSDAVPAEIRIMHRITICGDTPY